MLLAALVAIAALFAVPHLDEALWQDESVTLLFFSLQGPWTALTSYDSPNSHMGFTAMLAAWLRFFRDGLDVPSLRLLPLLLSLSALPLTFFATRRLSGALAAAIATALMAQSAVMENFATQLRGYGPSWPFMAAALWCGLNSTGRYRVAAWQAGYLAASLVAISILPTNLVLLALTSLAVAIQSQAAGAPYALRPSVCLILLVGPPACFLVAYSAVLFDLVEHSGVDFSSWTRLDLLAAWLRGTLGDERWILPLVVSAMVATVTLSHRRSPDTFGTQATLPDGVLPLLLLLVPAVFVFLLPKPGFPRTLTPFLPIWYCAVGSLIAMAIRALTNRRSRNAAAAGLFAGAAAVLLVPAPRDCRGATAEGAGSTEYDLCYQYFRDDYHPSRVVDAWAELGRPDVSIVTDYEGVHAIRALDAPVRVDEYRTVVRVLRPPLIVAHDSRDRERFQAAMGLAKQPYRLLTDTGYFKVYVPVP